jgi:hypothetical protein
MIKTAITSLKRTNLKETAMKTGLFNEDEFETSESLKGIIESLNEKELKQIIATRLVESLQNNKENEVEVSTKNETATINLSNDEVNLDYKSTMKSYFGGRK